jgi:predicted amidophosphoribosyltransferase
MSIERPAGGCGMNIQNCPDCGKVFVRNKFDLCPECLEREAEDEERVVSFLRDKGKSSIKEISAVTGVKEKVVFRMMKRGSFAGNFQIDYPCELCGREINEGRLCSACQKNILNQAKEYNNDMDEQRKKEELISRRNSGMHI